MCKYRVRYFYSKGAFLVQIWTLLVTTASSAVVNDVTVYTELCGDAFQIPKWLLAIPVVLGLFGAVFSGWLADAKLGNYRVVKYSIILLFITNIGGSIVTLLPCSVHNVYTISVVLCMVASAFMICLVSFTVTAVQLGLDQMPDASSSSITSFIAWFVFCFYTGGWIGSLLDYTEQFRFNRIMWQIQLGSLVAPVCMTIVLVLEFVLAEKWLLIEPKSPQSLKTIYQVLKFAWKHKSPPNRSALTYWEENVPSRMDLGKSRYGGPFTTEQVEDVKTILRLLPLCLTLWLLVIARTVFFGSANAFEFLGLTVFQNRMIRLFTYNSWWCGMVWTVFYEFVIYPLIRNRLPSILRRIGIISFLIVASSVVLLSLELVLYYHGELVAIENVKIVLHSVSRGLLTILLSTTMLEFVCAQAPYNMRGKFGGLITLTFICSISFEKVFPPKLIIYGISTGFSLFGFVVYCLLARWYKRRVRDEEYCTQTVVEEVYDRYLSSR